LEYREAMARLGAAVNVVTTDGLAGPAGFTASAVCSVTDDPPTLLVCQNRASESNAVFKANAVVCVNVLTDRHRDLSDIFAGGVTVSAARFGWGRWERMATGAPVLADAAVSFDCRVAQVTEVGTHSVFFCEVEAIRLGAAADGLIYFARAYHRLAM
jgi:flavin reductase